MFCILNAQFRWIIITKLRLLLSHKERKRIFRHVRPAKFQIRLCIRTVWSESSLGTFWTANDAKFLHADNEDSDQTARSHRLIWVVVGLTCPKGRLLTLWLSLFSLFTIVSKQFQQIICIEQMQYWITARIFSDSIVLNAKIKLNSFESRH